jgi:hypothetical protein
LNEFDLSPRLLNDLVIHQKNDKRIAALFTEYKRIAGYYQRLARQTFQYLLPQLTSKYQLSLHIIYALYSHLYEKINPHNQAISETDLNLSPFEVQQRINLTVSTFQPV